MGFSLPSTITYWVPLSNNGTGGKAWDSPKQTAARVAQTDQVGFDANGKEFKADKAIYTRVSIPLGAYVALGDTIAPSPTTGSQMVRSIASNTSFIDLYKLMV